MFAKKTYRDSRWIERILTIGQTDDLYGPECDWLTVRPQYMVEVRERLPLDSLPPYDVDWKPVSHIRLIGANGIVYLQCILTFGLTVDIHHRGDIRITYST